MREFTVTKNDAGQRLDRWLGKTLPPVSYTHLTLPTTSRV